MHVTDCSFPLASYGVTIPADHGYLLYSAVSGALETAHGARGLGIHPIAGRQVGFRRVEVTTSSHVSLRLPARDLPSFVCIAGRSIWLGKTRLVLGAPRVRLLQPATTLRSRLVTIKGFTEKYSFRSAVRRQLTAMEVEDEVKIRIGKRRTMRIRQKEIVGFEVILEGIQQLDALPIQWYGIGGRRRMGAGLFTPIQGTKP